MIITTIKTQNKKIERLKERYVYQTVIATILLMHTLLDALVGFNRYANFSSMKMMLFATNRQFFQF